MESCGHKPRNAAPRRWKSQEMDSLVEPSGKYDPVDMLILDFLASRIVREYISVVLSHQICGNLLQYLQEANSAPILLLIHEHSTFLCQYPELKGGALESRGVAV